MYASATDFSRPSMSSHHTTKTLFSTSPALMFRILQLKNVKLVPTISALLLLSQILSITSASSYYILFLTP